MLENFQLQFFISQPTYFISSLSYHLWIKNEREGCQGREIHIDKLLTLNLKTFVAVFTVLYFVFYSILKFSFCFKIIPYTFAKTNYSRSKKCPGEKNSGHYACNQVKLSS